MHYCWSWSARTSVPSELSPYSLKYRETNRTLLIKLRFCSRKISTKSREGKRDLRCGIVSDVLARGSTPDFRWRGWSNGGKNQNPKNSLGLQTKPQKIPGPTEKLNWPQKDPLPNFRRITRLGYTGTTTNLQCFEHPKYICQIFLPQKTRNLKVQTQKTPCIIRINWNPEYPPPPLFTGRYVIPCYTPVQTWRLSLVVVCWYVLQESLL